MTARPALGAVMRTPAVRRRRGEADLLYRLVRVLHDATIDHELRGRVDLERLTHDLDDLAGRCRQLRSTLVEVGSAGSASSASPAGESE